MSQPSGDEAVQRRRRADDLGRAVERLRAVLDVSRALSSLDDEMELLELIASAACRCLAYGACAVGVRDASGAYRYRATSGCSVEEDRYLRGLVMSSEAFEELRAAATPFGSVLYIPAGHPVREHPEVKKCVMSTRATGPSDGWQAGALLLVPLLGLDGEVVGFLNPDDPLDGKLPSDGQIAVLETFAHQAVVALQVVRGRAAERERARWAEKQRRQLEGLLQASASVRSYLQLDEVLQQIARAMAETGAFAGAVIYLYDAETEELHARASIGLEAEEDARLRATPVPLDVFKHLMQPEMRVSRSFFFDHRHHTIPDDAAEYFSTPELPFDWQEGEWHPEDSLMIPLEDRAGHWIGVISVDEPVDKRLPDLARVQALELFADHCVVAVEQARLYEQMQRLAMTDALTGLPNRTLLNDRLQQAIVAAGRVSQPLALLLMDLDHFKEVNDTLGHHAGDLLLRHVGARVRHVLRASDTVARLGGDEFAIVLPSGDAEGAARVAQAILDALATPITINDHAIDAGASIGVALFPAHGADAPALLRRADVAMYVAKRAHRGFVIYSEEQDHHNLHRLALMTTLRQSLDEGRLRLHYQPLVNLETGAVTGVEALVRWPHAEQGLIPPDEFIPLAEQTGVIVPLTHWVLEEALRQCRDWQRAGRGIDVAVNLSVRALHDTQLPTTVRSLIRRYGIAPRRLTLEITESMLMADPMRALQVLKQLDRIGVRIAIDDFGTGYSSLGYLQQLPVDQVKIDKSFVLSLSSAQSKDAAIVRSVIAMAQALGLEVVAEGVETEEAWALLASLGCATAQGYYISKPRPAAELEEWLCAAPPARTRRATAHSSATA